MKDETEQAIEKMLDLYDKKIRETFEPEKKQRLERLKKKYAHQLDELRTPKLL